MTALWGDVNAEGTKDEENERYEDEQSEKEDVSYGQMRKYQVFSNSEDEPQTKRMQNIRFGLLIVVLFCIWCGCEFNMYWFHGLLTW